MRKIISLYKRNYETDRLVRDEVVEGAEWVIAGEGVGTRKWDGTACMIRGGRLFKRYDVKKGRKPPVDFEPAQDADSVTGHWPGWVPVGDGPEDRWHREAFEFKQSAHPFGIDDGTYELIGPKVQGNSEKRDRHMLVRHGRDVIEDAPRDFAGLKQWFADHPDIEGIVWHHPDGMMVKIKAKDFGYKR